MKTTILLLSLALLIFAQDDHHAGVNQRGDRVMGFSHETTTHHFELYKDGGMIEVAADDVKDTPSRAQIRAHLPHIAQMFAGGDFNAPMLVHGQAAPGTATISRLKLQLHYEYQETPRGGRVRITADNKEALAALHQFLRFQIEDHLTGDCTAVR